MRAWTPLAVYFPSLLILTTVNASSLNLNMLDIWKTVDCTTLRKRTPTQDMIVVKSVERYGKGAHELLAELDLNQLLEDSWVVPTMRERKVSKTENKILLTVTTVK